MNQSPTTRIDVTPNEADQRLDVVLAGRLGLSRKQVRRLLEQPVVLHNGATVCPRDGGIQLAVHDRVEVLAFKRPEDQRAIAQMDLPLNQIAGDRGWIMVNKPAGMPVHPLADDEQDTVLNALSARQPQVHGVGEGGLRSGVVHRLDVSTSGTLLFALDQTHWQNFRLAFTQHRTRKIYHAIVHGSPAGTMDITQYLMVGQHRPARVRVVTDTPLAHDPGARRCTLRWRALETFASASLIQIELGTGFLHQIRVMMAHMGHPIVGDTVYTSPHGDKVVAADRPMLHAAELEVAQASGQCQVPDDFQEMLTQLREGKGAKGPRGQGAKGSESESGPS